MIAVGKCLESLEGHDRGRHDHRRAEFDEERRGQRDPEMHQTKKGKQWHFGMKVHVGVDTQSKVIHSVVITPANMADCKVLGDLLHGNETRVYGDQAYKSQSEVIRAEAPKARDFTIGSANGSTTSTRRSGEESDQVAHPRPSRALHRRDQAGVRLQQGALSRAG